MLLASPLQYWHHLQHTDIDVGVGVALHVSVYIDATQETRKHVSYCVTHKVEVEAAFGEVESGDSLGFLDEAESTLRVWPQGIV